jgi:hypothetical protein
MEARVYDFGIGDREREKLSLEQGEIEGRVKSIKSLMKNMKLSAEAAMKAIGIPKEDFSKYITML